MINTHKARTGKRLLSAGLALTLLCGPAGRMLTPVHAADAVTNNAPSVVSSILLFPFANNAGASAAAVGPQLDDAIKLRLNAIGAYKVTSYTKFLPSVQRASVDNVLSQDDLSKASSDLQVSGKIAAQVATDDYLTGAVETYTADPTTRKVKVEVSADLRSTQTGSALRTIAFTGEAAPVSASDTLQTVTQQAIDTVAGKIVASINSGRSGHSVMAASQRGHSSAGQKFLIGVLASSLLIAILSNSHGSNGNNSSSGGPVTTGGTGTTGVGGVPPVPSPPTPPRQ